MMNIRKNIRLAMGLGFMSILLLAAGDAYVKTKEVPMKADFIRSDELGNVFVVKDKQLTKYNKSGDRLHSYTNLYAGSISFVDTHDPFKLLLFYQAFGQVEFLDHTLSLTSSRIDLNEISLGLSTLACASYQGAFWVYDPTNFELVRVTQSLEIAERSGNLQQATGIALDPNYMIERDNYLYLNDPHTGILIFDKYGTYYRTIPVKGLSYFQVFNKRVIYTADGQIFIYDTQRNEYSSTSLPEAGAASVSACLSLEPQMLYVFKEGKLMFYEIR
ncbi:MAG TPA: hypothetical protein VK994_05925 [Bacteroidales bacterium]|nr:hypothetical protein [Bacteroidales bacterium]